MRLGAALAVPALALTGLVALGPATTAPTYAATAAPSGRVAVVSNVVIGRSVQGRPIRAYRLGQPGKPRVLLIATMHGNEGRPKQILTALRDGRRIRGIDLWVIPVYNPDGLAHGTRKNAHGVDLNRNFPYHWAPLTGSYYSGPKAASEPETRAAMRFLRKIRPGRIVSFHQPLHGVDTDTKSQRLSQRLSRYLGLPRKNFSCGGVCHGTMTGWFNKHFAGAAITVEYGGGPSRHRMRVDAPRQLLRMFGARRVG